MIDAEEVVRRAKLRIVGLGFCQLREALAQCMGKEREDPEVDRLYQSINRGLARRETVAEASRVLSVPASYWFETDETEIRRLALAPAQEAQGDEGGAAR